MRTKSRRQYKEISKSEHVQTTVVITLRMNKLIKLEHLYGYFRARRRQMYLLLGARGIVPDVECGGAGLECGVGLGTACCAGGDDPQHFLLNHTCRENRNRKIPE